MACAVASSRCREEALEPDPLSTGEEAEVRVVVVVVDTPPSLNDAVGVEKLDGVVSFKKKCVKTVDVRVSGRVCSSAKTSPSCSAVVLMLGKTLRVAAGEQQFAAEFTLRVSAALWQVLETR